MIKKDTVLFHGREKEDKIFLSSVYDAYRRTAEKGIPAFTGFMSERKQSLTESAFFSEKEIKMSFYGGFNNAERKMLCFHEEEIYDYPIGIIRVGVNSKEELSHRDYLGAIMGLGIERDTIGDIIVSGRERFVFAKKEICDYIIMNLKEVGRYRASCEITDNLPIIDNGSFDELKVTVASMRLDCVLSASLNLSREKAKLLIESGRVCVGGKPSENPDFKIAENAVISARGFGRIIMDGISGTSKKGRTILKIKKTH